MKAEWTATTPVVAKVTLGDDAARHTIEVEGLGGDSAVQVEDLIRAAAPAQFARGNIRGELALVCAKSHASHDAAIAYAIAERNRVDQTGTLELTFGSSKATAAGAILRSVRVVRIVGVRWWISYTFNITTLTLPA